MRNTLIVILLCLNTPLFSQVTVGFQLGGGMADNSKIFNLHNRRILQADGVAAATAGAVVTVGLNDKWVLQTEVNADLRGNSRLATRNHYLYLSLPLLLRRQWAQGQTFQPYVLSGVYGARLLGRRQVIDYSQPVSKILLPEYGRPRRYDVGLLLAVGAECPLHRRWSLTAECRATWGLLHLYPTGDELMLTERITNVSWGLNAGVRRRL